MDTATIEALIALLQKMKAVNAQHSDFVSSVAFTFSSVDSIAEQGQKSIQTNGEMDSAIDDTITYLQASLNKGGTK
jgi:hypothetical protein